MLITCTFSNGAGVTALDMKFELDRLICYDDASIIAEVQRVASLITEPFITREDFDALSRVNSYTCIRRFGGWQDTLRAAGIATRYSGRHISQTMRRQPYRSLTNDEIVAELHRISLVVGKSVVTVSDVREHSQLLGYRVIVNRFGSWSAALQAAGLELSRHGVRWTDDDYFENLLAVWTHYGRTPRCEEMDRPPSHISSGAYANKFGTWGKAKVAFLERVNSDPQPSRHEISPPSVSAQALGAQPDRANSRGIPLGLRFKVLRRDRFRCTLCGRSPATDLSCVLHVDHIIPESRGGKTVAENLRALCDKCNNGRGNRYID